MAEEGQPGFRWGNWKYWAALATAEFAVILILTTGLAHFVVRQNEDSEVLEAANQTFQVAAKRWQSCRNYTRMLEANATSLSSQVAQLNASLQLKELENKVLGDTLVLLNNWTQQLLDLNNHQKEIIGQLQQQGQLPGCGHRAHLYFGLASLLLTAVVILQV